MVTRNPLARSPSGPVGMPPRTSVAAANPPFITLLRDSGHVTVPAGAKAVVVHLVGAGGGSGGNNNGGVGGTSGKGGMGGYLRGRIAVTPGEQLRATVGQPGAGGTGGNTPGNGGTRTELHRGTTLIGRAGGGGGGSSSQLGGPPQPAPSGSPGGPSAANGSGDGSVGSLSNGAGGAGGLNDPGILTGVVNQTGTDEGFAFQSGMRLVAGFGGPAVTAAALAFGVSGEGGVILLEWEF